MVTLDICLQALLDAARDALAVPPPRTPEARMAYLELCQDRGSAVRYALDHASATGDVDWAVALIDGAVADLPVTYPTAPEWQSPLDRTPEAALDGTPCIPGLAHDYIPEPLDPRWPRVRSMTCRHCGDIQTVTG